MMVERNKSLSIRLLFVDRSSNSAEEKVSALRNAGIAVHPQVACNPAELESLSENADPDLILYAAPGKNLDLPSAVAICRKQFPETPMIVSAAGQDQDELIDAMRQGVRDILFTDEPELLVLVVKREFDDLTARRSLEALQESLRESEQRCAVLMKSSRDAIVYVHDGMHVYGNPAYLQMFGYDDSDEIEGLPILEMIESGERDRFKKYLRGLGAETTELEIGCQDNAGKVFRSRLEFSPASIDGEPCTQIIFRIQKENAELEEALERLRSKDSGTGLFNRDYFISRLQPLVDERAGKSDVCALFYLSLDGFHEIRSRIGLSSSDKLLNEVAHVIAGNINDGDLLARFGDHSFTLLGCRENRAALNVVGDNLLKAVAAHLFQDKRDLVEPTCSIGVAYLDDRILSGQDLLNNADHACRLSGQNGGNRITIYDPVKMGSRFGGAGEASEARITELLKHALANDRFKLVYQPIVSLQGESAENYAVLVRLLDNNDSEILPNYFLQYLREENLEPRFDRLVTEKAVAELKNQRTDECKTRFFINICGSTIEDTEFLPWLRGCMKKHDVKGSWLTFQARESELRTHMQAAKPFFEGLRDLGAQVAIAQFGRHPKPETLLKHIPFDWVKFDHSLVTEMTKDQQIQDRVAALNGEIVGLGAKSIAVGVEDANTLAVLWNVGINSVQGYFLQEPSVELSFDTRAAASAGA